MLNRRDFLKWAGATGAAVAAANVLPVSAQDHGGHGGGAGGHVPEPPEGYVFNNKPYPREDPNNGWTMFHENVRELPFTNIPRKPLTSAPNLMDLQPLQVESKDGVLELDMNIEFAYGVVNGQTVNVRTYNGKFPAPALIAKPGDVLRLRQINKLPLEAPHGPMTDINQAHGFNVFNLHVHGLNVSPEGNEDNVLLEVHPGQTFQNEIHIPADHPTGTYWYHPHKHGASAQHVGSGMASYLILTDPEKDIRAVPEIGAAKEVFLMFQEMYLQDMYDGVGEAPGHPNSVEDWFFSDKIRVESCINGTACNELQEDGSFIIPEIHMRPGEVQHWRFSHAGIFINMPLTIEDHQFHIVAYDGITADKVTTVDELFIVSGQRRDLLIKANAKPGVYAVKRRAGYQQAAEVNRWYEKTLFNIVVEGTPMNMPLPTKLNPPSERMPYIKDEEIIRKREVAFSFVDNTALGIFIFTIDGKVFKPGRIDYTMVLDTAEEWLITNDKGSDHPFHFHVNWFELLEEVDHEGNKTVHNPPLWMDTANIPRSGSILIRHRFQNYDGVAVTHCHILNHEDEGMMSVLEFVSATPKTTTITPAGGTALSQDYANMVQARFPKGAVDADTDVTYQYNSSPNQPTVEVAPALPDGWADYNRFFTLSAKQGDNEVAELKRAAMIEVKYSAAQTDSYVAPSTVGVYRYDEESQSWTNEGISICSRSSSLICFTTKKLGQFTVTGPTSECLDFAAPAGIGTEDVAAIQLRKDSPFEFFVKRFDVVKEGDSNGAVDDQDILKVVNAQGTFCAE